MALSAVHLQLKQAYETNNMSLEEIYAEFPDLQPVAIKSALMQSSSKYRKDCGMESEDKDDLNFTDDELRAVNQTIIQLALASDDENIRLKAATYVRDDKKGRKEVVKAIAGNTFNILNFNEQVQQARARVASLKAKIIEAT